jgi:hypothetical protein
MDARRIRATSNGTNAFYSAIPRQATLSPGSFIAPAGS